MVGKTFKGLTDEMLAWQTDRFLELEDATSTGHVVRRRARAGGRDRLRRRAAIDPLLRTASHCDSPASVATGDDKTAAEADSIETVRRMLG